jgi:hypothetical protein
MLIIKIYSSKKSRKFNVEHGIDILPHINSCQIINKSILFKAKITTDLISSSKSNR